MPDINVGQLAEAINDKTDRDMQNVDNTAGADAIVDYQEPNAGNNYTWYRKYKSGWVEQGGTSTTSPVVYPCAMADTDYTLVSVPHYNSNTQVYWSDFGYTKTTTGFSFRIPAYGIDWIVSGKAE